MQEEETKIENVKNKQQFEKSKFFQKKSSKFVAPERKEELIALIL